VVTGDAPMLRMFDRDGRPMRSGARAGSGPGEFLLPVRGALAANGSVHVVDMRLRRVTHLAPDLHVLGSRTIGQFPVAVGARGGSGELIVMTDDFRGARYLERWSPDADSARVIGRSPADADSVGSVAAIRSVAIAPSGEIAVTDGARYRIMRLGPRGERIADITRDVSRVRRTPVEQAELDQRLAAGPGHAAEERKRAKVAAPLISPGAATSLGLKPHFSGDALRYDDAGRLWVLTMRGDERRSVFDVFDADARYVGELTLDRRVRTYALAGGYLATSGETADGDPVVTLWSIR
jgi:hypothetical protein